MGPRPALENLYESVFPRRDLPRLTFCIQSHNMSGRVVIAEIGYVPIDYRHAMPAWRVPGVLVFIREDDSDVNAPGYL